ncbi:ABC transporter substrate-binding protein [Malikia granosa]|uniref:ABC transporter substrate-binding protein n=1 Tax=Malikia granosa TaxID=263067 RepID=A0A2S9K4U4_9BURK|nr:ABC transporter substrate-binding protein [Malikia granosa]PRD65405.1 ABC transporter substrate-binding protein [Malikia granosa]
MSQILLNNRREWLKLASLLSAGGALPLLQSFEARAATDANAPVRIGYLPITDATPLLVAHHNKLYEAQGLQVEPPRMFRSWAQLVEAFIAGQVNVVHLLSPITVWARYGSKVPAKVVAWNHVGGSALTVAPEINDIRQLGGKTVAVPFWYSMHNVVLQHLLREAKLEAVTKGDAGPQQVKLVVMAPSDMTPALASKQIAGFIVAEPFNASAELLKVGKVLRFTGDVWKNHACCVVFMHERDLNQRPEWSQKVVSSLVQAQAWIQDNRAATARLLAKDGANRYTPHSAKALLRVLEPSADQARQYQASGAIRHPEWKEERIDFQPYPFPSYTEKMVELLKLTQIEGNNAFIQSLDGKKTAADLVDDRFVKQALRQVGGLKTFGFPESFGRTEVFGS